MATLCYGLEWVFSKYTHLTIEMVNVYKTVALKWYYTTNFRIVLSTSLRESMWIFSIKTYFSSYSVVMETCAFGLFKRLAGARISFTYLENEIASYHYSHLLMQNVLGLLCTWPLRKIYHRSFKLTVLPQISLVLFSSSFFALVWTCLRIPFYIWVSETSDKWDEFNGWFYGACILLLSITFYTS